MVELEAKFGALQARQTDRCLNRNVVAYGHALPSSARLLSQGQMSLGTEVSVFLRCSYQLTSHAFGP